MPANPRRQDAETEGEIVALHKPKFVVFEGRGGSGKTTGVRLFMERALQGGRDVTLIDLDPRAQLKDYFGEVVAPTHPDEVVVHRFLDALVNAQAEADPRPTLLVDMNGNDPVFGRFAAEVGLPELLDDLGVMPVRVRFLGTDMEDLADLARDNARAAFVPAQTVLVLNAGVIKNGMPADAAFAPVREHPVFRATVEAGARVVELPRLACMGKVSDLRLRFADAEASDKVFVTDKQRLKAWRRAVEDALAPVASWLP